MKPQRHTLTVKFLTQFLDKSARPTKGDLIIRDTKTDGFGVRISPGKISFFVQRKMGGSVSVKRTIGPFPDLTVEQARDEAEDMKREMRKGNDPLVKIYEDRRNSAEALARMRHTFGKVFEEYMESKREKSSPLTIKDREKVKRKIEHSTLWTTSSEDVSVGLVKLTLDPHFKKSPATGWKIYRFCRAAYGFRSITNKTGSDNPFTSWRKENQPRLLERRQTTLPTDEKAGQKWLSELVMLRKHESPYVSITADYLICVLLWGGRKTETQKLRATDIDFKGGVVAFRWENTKNKKSHYFPLTSWAASILNERIKKNGETEEGWVFPSRVKGKHIVDIRRVLEMLTAASGLKIGAHDLRRTFASELTSDTGANLFIVKVAMNHADINQDVTAGYIDTKTKVKSLRPAYELRERRLMKLAGLKVPKATIPDDALKIIQAAAANPDLKKLLQQALQ